MRLALLKYIPLFWVCILLFASHRPVVGQDDVPPKNEATTNKSTDESTDLNKLHDVKIGAKLELESEVLSEKRQVMISLPPSYANGNQAYPVIYLLDGRSNFLHTTSTAKFLSQTGSVPEAIVVAIINTNRTRDLTPKSEAEFDLRQYPTGGGADRFHSFLEKELIPTIESQFRVTQDRALIGHSFGGLFALHVFIEHPETFGRYLVISPSLWWNEMRLVPKLEDKLKKMADAKSPSCRFYMTLGNEKGKMLESLDKAHEALKTHAPENLKWEFSILDDESHLSVPYLSTYRGLKFVLDGARIEKQKSNNKQAIEKTKK